jgi:hypothetical protein
MRLDVAPELVRAALTWITWLAEGLRLGSKSSISTRTSRISSGTRRASFHLRFSSSCDVLRGVASAQTDAECFARGEGAGGSARGRTHH